MQQQLEHDQRIQFPSVVREANTSQHKGARIDIPSLKPPRYHINGIHRAFQRDLNRASMTKIREALSEGCLSDNTRYIPDVPMHTEKYFRDSYQIKPISDSIYHAPIDLEQQTDVHAKYYLISVSFNKIRKIFLCVCRIRDRSGTSSLAPPCC